MVYEEIDCSCGRKARIVESGVGTYIDCPYCGAHTYMCTTKLEAIQKFKEKNKMEEMTKRRTYEEFKQEFDENIRKTAADMQSVAEDFVVTGYLLREAEDTDILMESGYTSMGEFALQCYGITKDLASRYIAINKKYSEGGCSKQLDSKYTNFGYSKLAEMLTLPEVVADEISPEMTREDIREIKSEIKEENAVTDIEVMLEAKDQEIEEEEGTLAKVLYQIGHENPEIFKRLWVAVDESLPQNLTENLFDALAPSGIAMLSCRIPGTGRLMMSVKGLDENLQVINIRSNEKEEFTWEELRQVADRLCEGFYGSWREAWEEKYSEKLPEEKPEVAPAQPKAERVVKAKPKKPEKPKEEEKPKVQDSEPVPKEQLPGQMEVGDFPEMMPKQEEKDEIGETGDSRGSHASGSGECIPEDDGAGEPASTGNGEPEQETEESNEEGGQKESKTYEELKEETEEMAHGVYDVFWGWSEEKVVHKGELAKALENAKKLVGMIEQLMEMTEEECGENGNI